VFDEAPFDLKLDIKRAGVDLDQQRASVTHKR
jgi:hypothetical protein